MPEAISNTSPLLYLYRINSLDWLPEIFGETWIPTGVVGELREGQRRGYDVPDPDDYAWLQVIEPGSAPSEWLTLDLGIGELEVMALALENPDRVVLIDDAWARRIAKAAELKVWGTLRVLLEAKSQGLTKSLRPLVGQLRDSGMWISDDIQRRVLSLAGETLEK
jgi:hypothetical protein